MAKKTKSVLLVIACTFFTSFGQIFLKTGADRIIPNSFLSYANPALVAGLALYIFGAFLLILALRIGELSVLYPIIATSFIWVTILSLFILNESITHLKWSGIILIVIGVSVIGMVKT